jgi:hypothetical protein
MDAEMVNSSWWQIEYLFSVVQFTFEWTPKHANDLVLSGTICKLTGQASIGEIFTWSNFADS